MVIELDSHGRLALAWFCGLGNRHRVLWLLLLLWVQFLLLDYFLAIDGHLEVFVHRLLNLSGLILRIHVIDLLVGNLCHVVQELVLLSVGDGEELAMA